MADAGALPVPILEKLGISHAAKRTRPVPCPLWLLLLLFLLLLLLHLLGTRPVTVRQPYTSIKPLMKGDD